MGSMEDRPKTPATSRLRLLPSSRPALDVLFFSLFVETHSNKIRSLNGNKIGNGNKIYRFDERKIAS